MMQQWEYTTIGLRIVQRRERGSVFFSHHTVARNFDQGSETSLSEMGKQGWELVSVVPLSSGGGGPDFAVGIMKRPMQSK